MPLKGLLKKLRRQRNPQQPQQLPTPEPPQVPYAVGQEVLLPLHLHFIWIGIQLPHSQASNFCKWALENPDYDIYLWTESENMEPNAQVLHGLFNEALEIEDIELTREADFVYLECERRDGRVLQIYVRSISTLPHLNDRGLVYEEIFTWRNYGAASDILRIWVLHELGGVYMDFDTYSTGAPLPSRIVAPRGILFGVFAELPPGSTAAPAYLLVNAIIGAPKGANELKEIARFMDERYEHEYPTREDGVRGFSDDARERYANVQTLREQISLHPPNEDDLRWELRKEMEQVTLYRSGPVLVRHWLEQYRDIFPWNPEIRLYYFQLQAGYDLRIESDGSWIK